MKRATERRLLIAGSIWNLFTALLTIFSYNTWFTEEGGRHFQGGEASLLITGTHLMDNVSKVIFVFGLFIFAGSIINFLIAIKLKDNMIQHKILTWIGIWGIIQLVSMDVLGFLIYLIAFVIYLAKNKAIKLSKGQLSIS